MSNPYEVGEVLVGFGPHNEQTGVDTRLFYEKSVGFGHLEVVSLRKPYYEGMAAEAIHVHFDDASKGKLIDYPSGQGYLKTEDIITSEEGTKKLVARAIEQRMRFLTSD